MWNVLPVIRKELAKCMINDFGLTQKNAAEKLGLTPAAVCQYLSQKRGGKTKIEIDDKMKKQIHNSAKRIIDNGTNNVVDETCRICKLLRKNGALSEICDICS